MFKYLKQLTSLVAMVAVLFTFTTESFAAKKSKTLKNTQKKGFCLLYTSPSPRD